MKKTYRYKFNTAIIVFLILSIAISLFGTLYSAFRLAGILGQISLFPVIDISAIVVCTLIQIAVIVLSVETKYVFEKECFCFKMFFFKKKIPAEALNYIVEDEETKQLFLYFVTNPEQGIFEFLPIIIDKDKNGDFLKDIKKFYPTVIIDEFKK